MKNANKEQALLNNFTQFPKNSSEIDALITEGLLNMLDEFVTVQDTEGKILKANKAAAQTVNMTPDELAGHYCFKVWYNADGRCNQCPAMDCLIYGTTSYKSFTTSDKRSWFIKSQPLKDNYDNLIGVLNLTKETTEQVKAEEAIQLYQQRNEAFLKAIPDLMFVLDREGHYLDIQSGADDLLLDNKDQLIGKKISEVVPSQVNQKFEKYKAEVIDNKKIKQFNYHLQQNHSTYYYEVRLVPYETDKIFAIVRNVTQLKKAEKKQRESYQRFHELTDLLPETIFETDKDLNFSFVNSSGLALTGYTKNDIDAGMNIVDLITSKDQHRLQEHLDFQKNSKDMGPHEYNLVLKNGTTVPILLYTRSILQNNHFKGIRGIIVDIAERKKMEEELRHAKEKAEESDKLKSIFLANISHEIRTPLNGIMGFTDLLKDQSLSQEEYQNYLRIINRKGQHLLNIISEIMDVSQIESGHIKLLPEEINVNQFLKELYPYFENEKLQNDKNHLKIILENNPENSETTYIYADKIRIKQIFTNLVKNAIKYTETGYIQIGYTLKQTNMIQFYVKDTGKGIEKDKQNVIFNRFRQEDEGYTRSFGGIGLGLTITKELIENMGGSIWVDSETNKGSIFYFSVPKFIQKHLSHSTSASSTSNNRNINWNNQTILIVEDDYSSFLFLQAVLKKTKANIVRATDGHKAIEICKNQHIDLVLMDLQIPNMDGYEATKKIKEFRKNIPIIAQTAHVLEEDKNKSIKAGCDDYIPKPIDKNKLLEILDKYL